MMALGAALFLAAFLLIPVVVFVWISKRAYKTGQRINTAAQAVIDQQKENPK